jgi:ankyrin repeat protein
MRERLMILLSAAIILGMTDCAVAVAFGVTRPIQVSRNDQDLSLVDTSFGFPITIAFSSSRSSGQEYRWRTLFVLIEDRYCSPEVLRTVFEGLAGRYPESNFIEIDAYSDPEMLRRAIGRFKQYPDELQFSDAPEDQEFEKLIRGDLYIPKTGWARAIYSENARDGEEFYYKPDPDKVEMVKVVIKPPPVPAYVGELQPDLFLACRLGDLPKTKALIENGAKVNYKDEKGETPLVYAVGYDRSEIVKLLLAHGANVDAKDKYGQSVLYRALTHKFHEIVSILLEHNADVRVSNDRGVTPLQLASYGGDAEGVEALLSKGADPNAVGGDGETPLFNAIRSRKIAIVEALLNRGALTSVRNHRGETPDDVAKKVGDRAIIDALKRHQ